MSQNSVNPPNSMHPVEMLQMVIAARRVDKDISHVMVVCQSPISLKGISFEATHIFTPAIENIGLTHTSVVVRFTDSNGISSSGAIPLSSVLAMAPVRVAPVEEEHVWRNVHDEY